MISFNKIPFGTPEEFNVLIEIPQGSANKYELNPETGILELDFVFKNGLRYPFSYGSVPQTLAGDGDPLDVMVFSSQPIAPLAIVKVKPFGVLKTQDRGEQDDKLLAVPIADALTEKFSDLKNLSEQTRQQIIAFWQEVARQKNKIIEIQGFEDKKSALQTIQKSIIKIL